VFALERTFHGSAFTDIREARADCRAGPRPFPSQEFAALTIFCNHDPRVPSVAGRPECPSALFDRRNRLVLRHFPSRAVGIDPADMMNPVVRAGSVGFVDTMDSNIAHGLGERLFESCFKERSVLGFG
jgi:hypothetical protein